MRTAINSALEHPIMLASADIHRFDGPIVGVLAERTLTTRYYGVSTPATAAELKQLLEGQRGIAAVWLQDAPVPTTSTKPRLALTVERCTVEDLTAVVRIDQQNWGAVGWANPIPVYRQMLETNSSAIFVARAPQGEVVGFTALLLNQQKNSAWIVTLDVQLAFRGCGVGSAMLHALTDYAKNSRLMALEGVVHPENLSSLLLLEKGGFTRQSLRPNYFGDGDTYLLLRREFSHEKSNSECECANEGLGTQTIKVTCSE